MQHRLVKLLGSAGPLADGRGQRDARTRSATAAGIWRPMRPWRMAGSCWPTAPTCSTWAANSTAPGSRPITSEEELPRLEPVVRALAREAVAVDRHLPCRHGRALHRAGRRGSSTTSPPCAPTPRWRRWSATCGPVLVMMHAKDGPLPHATDRPAHYRDVVREVADWLSARVDVALGGRHRRRPDRARPRLGQVPEPGAGAQLGAAGAVRRAGGAADADPGRWSASRARASSACRWPSAIRSRSSPASWPSQKGAALIRTHHVRMAAQFLDAAERMRLAAAGAARLRLSGSAAPPAARRRVRPSIGWRQSGQTSQNGARTKSRLCISGCGRRRASSSRTRSSTAIRSRSISRGRQRAVSRAAVAPEPGLDRDAARPGSPPGAGSCAAGRRR